MKSDESAASYLSQDNHPLIVSKSIFYAVQAEKEKRSSVIEAENGKQRKSTKYSSKSK
jgi:site-specific DNA recombinase